MNGNQTLNASKSYVLEIILSFVNFGGVFKATLEEGLRKDLRKSHFNFGDSTQFESLSHATHKNLAEESKKINSLGVFKELAQDLRKNHFDYGNDAANFTSTSAAGYKGISGPPSDLDKELAHDLRKHHFKYGTNDKIADMTQYRDTFCRTGNELMKGSKTSSSLSDTLNR